MSATKHRALIIPYGEYGVLILHFNAIAYSQNLLKKKPKIEIREEKVRDWAYTTPKYRSNNVELLLFLLLLQIVSVIFMHFSYFNFWLPLKILKHKRKRKQNKNVSPVFFISKIFNFIIFWLGFRWIWVEFFFVFEVKFTCQMVDCHYFLWKEFADLQQ